MNFAGDLGPLELLLFALLEAPGSQLGLQHHGLVPVGVEIGSGGLALEPSPGSLVSQLISIR